MPRIGNARLADQVLIREGSLRPVMKLPAEAELIRQYGLGRNMVRRALTILAEEQLIDPAPRQAGS